MTIGFGQIFIILLIVVLLFGNLPNILRDLAQGIKTFQEILKNKSKD